MPNPPSDKDIDAILQELDPLIDAIADNPAAGLGRHITLTQKLIGSLSLKEHDGHEIHAKYIVAVRQAVMAAPEIFSSNSLFRKKFEMVVTNFCSVELAKMGDTRSATKDLKKTNLYMTLGTLYKVQRRLGTISDQNAMFLGAIDANMISQGGQVRKDWQDMCKRVENRIPEGPK